jgi:HAD superfamily hydrolase (TIGR01509 family)
VAAEGGRPGLGSRRGGYRPVMSAPSSPAGILFDVDGTLVDTTYLHTVAWWQALRERGHRVPMAVIHRSVGMGSDHLLEHVLGADRDTSADQALSAAHGRYYRPFLERVEPLPGATDLLRACAARGLRVVLASSAGEEDLARLREVLGADDVIAAVTGAGDVASTKPAPDLVQVALERAGLPAGRAVFVGDAVWDVQAAGRAGLACIGLTCGGTGAAELTGAGAAAVYEDPAAMLADLDAAPLPRG